MAEQIPSVDALIPGNQQPPAFAASDVPKVDSFAVTQVPQMYETMSLTGDLGVKLGVVPPPDSGYVDAAMRGLRQFQLGLANTLDKLGFEGAADYLSELRSMMAVNQQRYNPEGASFLERGLEGTTAMLPTIAAGAAAAIATGGTAVPEEVGLLGTAAVNAWRASRVLKASMLAGSVAMEAQQYGDFYDEIDRASGGRLTPEQLHGLTFSRSLIDATLENVIPAEAILSVGAANIGKAVAGRWLKKEGGKESLELMGRSIFGFPMAGGFGRFAIAFPGELLEEGAQQANGDLFDAYASGQPVDLMAVAADSYDAMIQAIPAITMMVGMGAFVGAAKKEAVKRTTMAGVGEAETADHPHWKAVDEVLYGVQQPDGSIAVDPTLKQKEVDTVTALTELWSKNGAQAARESAQLVVQLAKNLAVQDRAAGSISAQAWDYTDGLSVGFGDMALADISTIRDMRAGGATGSQLLDFMLKASPAFANSIDSVFQKRETIRLNRENEVLRGTLKTVLRGTNPKAVLEGVDPKAISGRLKTVVDTYGLPDPTDPSEARIRIIPAAVVKAALGNRSLAAALAAQPMIVSPFGWEGVLEVRADGSATLTPVRPKKGKGAKAPIAGAPPVEAGQEAAQITADAQKVERDIRHQLVMRSVPTTVVGEAGPTLPTQTPQARLAEVERGTLEAADKSATDPNVEHATALRENLRLRHQNLMMENFGANWDAIPAAVAKPKVVEPPPPTAQERGVAVALRGTSELQQMMETMRKEDITALLNDVDAEHAAAEQRKVDLQRQKDAEQDAVTDEAMVEAATRAERLRVAAEEIRVANKPNVEAAATEMLRQMEVSGVTEVEDQLTALKNAAKAAGIQVAANENALSLAEKIAEAKAAAEVKAATPSLAAPEQLTLLQDGKELSGLYLPDRALMVYFRSADAGTFIHEWLHHVTTQRLLPSAIERTLLNAYGTDEDRKRGYIGSQQAHEDIANSLLLYIRDGQLPDNVDGEILKAFEHLKAVMKGSYSVLEAYTPGARGAALAQERRVPSEVSASDARYLDLAKDPVANKAELQAMVDEAAKKAGYTIGPLIHGTTKKFSTFIERKSAKRDESFSFGFHFTDSKELSLRYGSQQVSAMLRADNLLDVEQVVYKDSELGRWLSKVAPNTKWFPDNGREAVHLGNALDVLPSRKTKQVLIDAGYDAIRYNARFAEQDIKGQRVLARGDTTIVFDPSQIKSADPITRDDQGNVIPLSQRFNPGESDIRFQDRSASSGTLLELPGSISDLFGNLLSDVVPSESQQIAGETAAAGMQRNPPSQAEADLETEVGEALGGFAQERDIPQNAVAAEVGVRFNGSLQVEELHDDYYTDDAETGGTFAVPAGSDATAVRAALESMRQRFAANPPLAQEKHKRPEGVSKESMAKTRAFRAALNKKAISAAAQLGHNIKSLYDLGLDDKGLFNNDLYQANMRKIRSILAAQGRIKKAVRYQLLKESELMARANEYHGKIAKMWSALPNSLEEVTYRAKGGPKFYYAALKVATAVKVAVRTLSDFFTSMETKALWGSLNDYDHPFYDLFGYRPVYEDWSSIVKLQQEHADRDGTVINTINRNDSIQLGSREYEIQDALDFYFVANGEKVNESHDALVKRVDAAGWNSDKVSSRDRSLYAYLESNSMRDNMVTMEAINDAVDFVKNTPSVLAVAKHMQGEYDWAHKLANASFKGIYDREIPKVPGMYTSQQREDGFDHFTDVLENPTSQEFNQFIRGAPLPTYAKERRQGRGSPINTKAMDKYDRYIATMINVSVRLPTVVQQLAVLRDQGRGSLWELAHQKFGTTKVLSNLRQDVLNTMKVSGRTNPPTEADSWIRNNVRIPASVSTLGMKPWIILSQALPVVTAMGDISPFAAFKDFSKAIDYLVRSTPERIRSDITKFKNGEILIPNDSPLVGYADYDKYAQKSVYIRSDLGQWEINEAQARKSGRLDKMVRKAGVAHSWVDAMVRGMRIMDQVGKYVIFKGGYEQKLAELTRLNDPAAESKAVAYGDQLIRDHIPIANNAMRVVFHNAPEGYRLVAPFSGQPIAYYNMLQRRYALPFIQAYRMAEGGGLSKLGAAMGSQANWEQLRRSFFVFVLPCILWNALQRRRPPDREELFADLALYPFSMVPIVGDVVSQARFAATYGGLAQGDMKVPGMIPYYDATRMIKGVNNLYRGAMGDDVNWSAAWKDTLALPADLTSIPKFLVNAAPEVYRIRQDSEDRAERIQQALFYLTLGGPPKPERD